MASKIPESLKVPLRGITSSSEIVVGPSMDPKGQENEPRPKLLSPNEDELYHKEEERINQKVRFSQSLNPFMSVIP